MIYFEIQLDGRVNVFDMSDAVFLLCRQMEADAESLPLPRDMTMALDYVRSRCHQFELFDEIEDAGAWAERYTGFRAGEVRAALRRFLARKAELFLEDQSDKTDCRQNDEGKAVQYG